MTREWQNIKQNIHLHCRLVFLKTNETKSTRVAILVSHDLHHVQQSHSTLRSGSSGITDRLNLIQCHSTVSANSLYSIFLSCPGLYFSAWYCVNWNKHIVLICYHTNTYDWKKAVSSQCPAYFIHFSSSLCSSLAMLTAFPPKTLAIPSANPCNVISQQRLHTLA